jgi:NAD(P)-dependent dehydrogenase (short-subunit alcohol dehydrogenase family)
VNAELQGRIAVITGAGSGIGRSTALLFGRAGARLHLADINGDSLAAVVAEIEAAGGSATAHTVDCSDPDAVEALAERVFSAERRVDVLHNNAGIGHAGDIEQTTVDDWQRVIGLNLLGVAYGIEAFVPRMLRQGAPASIVNTASAAGLVGLPQMAPYCASKFGVVGMTEALDAELRPRGIRVSAICPGIIDTPIVSTSIMRGEAEERRQQAVDHYRRRGTSPDAVAQTVLAAVTKPRLVHVVPRAQVGTMWLAKRVSPRVTALLVRTLTRLARRRR